MGLEFLQGWDASHRSLLAGQDVVLGLSLVNSRNADPRYSESQVSRGCPLRLQYSREPAFARTCSLAKLRLDDIGNYPSITWRVPMMVSTQLVTATYKQHR